MTTDKTPTQPIYDSHYVEVLGNKIHYIEAGQGDPIVFLHGIPTSSYVWRNIIPYLTNLGRCIAVDLIGMGKSDKPDIEYTIFDHIKYIEKFIETLKLKNITFVMHGWGSLIGFDYAMRHEKNCKGLVFYEAYIRPANGEDASLPLQEQLHELNQQEDIYDIVTNGISFVDKIMPKEMLTQISHDELAEYRKPFMQKGSGRPLFQYIKELPHIDRDDKVNQLITDYSKKLAKSKLPKLMLYSVPGFVTTIATVMWAKDHLPNLEIGDVGEELHFAQESHPELMGETMSAWLQGIDTK